MIHFILQRDVFKHAMIISSRAKVYLDHDWFLSSRSVEMTDFSDDLELYEIHVHIWKWVKHWKIFIIFHD